MYTVDFVGLTYFNVCSAGKRAAYAPDGTKGEGGMPVHHASLFIRAENVEPGEWWPDHKIPRTIALAQTIGKYDISEVIEFRMPGRAEILFSCEDEAFKPTNIDKVLPQLQVIDTEFELDESGVIAEIPIQGGELKVFRFDPAAIVRWTIEKHADPIVIKVRVGRDTHEIKLKSSNNAPIEIIFNNTPDLLAAPEKPEPHHGHGDDEHAHDEHADDELAGDGQGAHTHADGHFSLYGKLNKGKNGAKKFEKEGTRDYSQLDILPTSHPYLAALQAKKEFPENKCVPVCC